MSDLVLFEIACQLEAEALVRFVSICSSVRDLSFDRKVWSRHFIHRELEGEEMRSVHDYIALYKRCKEVKQETEKFLCKLWTSYPQSSLIHTCNLPMSRIMDVVSFSEDMRECSQLSFVVLGEKRLYCIVEERDRKVIHKEYLNQEQSELLFYKLRLYNAIHPSFYEQIHAKYEIERREKLYWATRPVTKFSEYNDFWEGDSDEYTCYRCNKTIPEGEEEMSYQDKSIFCPACLKKELENWARNLVKEFVKSEREYVFVDKTDRERAFLYPELERQKIKFAKFTSWEQVTICEEHKTRNRNILGKKVCVQGILEEEKFLCEKKLVRSKTRKTVLYKGEARDRTDWRRLYETSL